MTVDSPTLAAVFAKLRTFILFIVPSSVEVVRGLGSRVSPPRGPHVVITLATLKRMSTNITTYADPTPSTGTAIAEQKTLVEAQVDFYSPDAPDWAVMFSTLFRSEAGCDMLKPECQPLHADDGTQAPFVSGEEQYESRVIVRAALQWNPVTSIPQEFADTLSADLLNVDVTYPP